MAQSSYEEQIREELFLEPDEKYLCCAGTAQLKRYLKKGKAGKGFAVLSDRAVYCKGKCLTSRDRRRYRNQKTNFRLDLEELQEIKIMQRKQMVLLSLAFFFLLLGPTLLLLDKLAHYADDIVLNPTLDAAICLLLSGVFLLLFSIHKKYLLELIHTNGSICLDKANFPEKEERLLVRYLRAYLRSRENPEEAGI